MLLDVELGGAVDVDGFDHAQSLFKKGHTQESGGTVAISQKRPFLSGNGLVIGLGDLVVLGESFKSD